MKVEREMYQTASLESFAEQHDLTLLVTERAMDGYQRRNRIERFMATFRGVEVQDGGVLRGVYGNGDTEEQAVSDYASQISGENLVVDAFKPTRREIYRVPRLTTGCCESRAASSARAAPQPDSQPVPPGVEHQRTEPVQ